MEPSDDRRGGEERLFLGVEMPEDARGRLAAHLRGALGSRALPGRAVAPASWHLTLRFLGGTPPTRRAALAGALRGADLGGGFTVAFGGLGALAAAAEEAARRAGFPAEDRPFSAHLTLSRIRPAVDVRPLLERVPAFHERIRVDDVVLFRSHLGAGGARYEAVERFPLRP